MLYKQFDMPVLSDDDNGVCESQTPAAGGVQSLSLDGALVSGGVATAAAAQIVTATWAGADVGRTLTVIFKDADGIEQTGTVPGGTTTTTSGTFHAVTISSITIDDDSAGAIEVGFLAVDGMVTKSYPTNRNQSPYNQSLVFDLTAGTMTASAQFTVDLPQVAYTNSFSTDADWRGVDGLTDVTADDKSNLIAPVAAVRFIQTIGSATGTATGTVMQGQNG